MVIVKRITNPNFKKVSFNLQKHKFKTMSIKTKTLKPSARKLFTVFINYYLKRRWWVGLIFLALIIINAFGIRSGRLDTMPLVALIIILTLIFYVNWRKFYFTGKKEKYSPVSYEIDKAGIFLIKEKNKKFVKFSDIRTVVKKKDYYLLFYTKNDFIYIPNTLFQSEEDMKTFKSWL